MAMNTTPGQGGKASIDVLNDHLRGEISATETFRQAIDKLRNEPVATTLEKCMQSHEARVAKLRARIRDLGGTPAESSGAWGAFAKLLEGGAKVFGKDSAISVLEEGEDRGLRNYREKQDQLDPESLRLVQSDLLVEQERTHATISALKHGRQ